MGDMSNALHYIRLCMQTVEKNHMMHYVPETLRDIYSPTGQLVRKQAHSLNGLPSSVYVVKGKKILVK